MTPPPPLHQKLPTLSPDVEKVVLTALEKDTQRRFRSVQAFAVALASASQSTSKASAPGDEKTIRVSRQSSAEQPPQAPAELSRPLVPAPVKVANSPQHTPTVANTPAARLNQPLDEPASVVQTPPATITRPPSVQSSRPEVVPVRKHTRRNVLIGLSVGAVAVGGGIAWRVLALPPYIYHGHSNSVNTVAWSPDGKCIASGSGDNTVQIWDAADGRNAYTYRGHSNEVNSVTW